MRTRVKVAIAGTVAVVAAGGGLLAWYVLGDDAPPPPRLPAAGATDTSGAPPAEVADGVEGTWAVRAEAALTEEGTFVGYRVEEVLTGINRTAVGRTPSVTGSITIAGTAVTQGAFTADLTGLDSDDDRRDARLRTIGLQTGQFPEAVFTLTAPIDLGAVPSAGERIVVEAVGELTLHGTTRPVTLPLEASLLDPSTFVVVGTLDVAFADYGIERPNIAGFVTTEDHGRLELQLFFERAG